MITLHISFKLGSERDDQCVNGMEEGESRHHLSWDEIKAPVSFHMNEDENRSNINLSSTLI